MGTVRLLTVIAVLLMIGPALAGPRIVYEDDFLYKTDSDVVTWSAEGAFVVCRDCPEPEGLELSSLRKLMKQLRTIPSVSPAPGSHSSSPSLPSTSVPPVPGKTFGPAHRPEPGPRVPEELRVFFGFDSAVLRPEARAEIERFLKALGPRVEGFEILGYACPIGPEDYNLRLSLRRAKAVARWIERLGGRVLSARGMGEVVFDPQRYWKSRCAVLKPKLSEEVQHVEGAVR